MNLLSQEEYDPILLISLIQEAIGHAGSLSFYFWNNGGSSKKSKEIKDYIQHRSNCFQKEFNLNDESALKNRILRNMFEHFDEKVDIFLINNLSGTFYPMPIIRKHTDIENKRLNKNFKLLDIEEKANFRNKIIYAEPNGILEITSSIEDEIDIYYQRVFKLIRIYCLIYPHNEKFDFIQNVIDAFVFMMNDIEM